jgi:Polyketide cyclase / dehydrase and lipid transport
MTHTALVREGVPAPDGVGALRHFSVGPAGGSREEVVVWEPPHHLGYVGRSGLPVRNYRADVYLLGDDAGTTVTWQGHFDELVPGSGRSMRWVLQRLTSGFGTRVCRYADTLAASPGTGV